MQSTAIVTDTNSSILPPDAAALGVHVIPMPFSVDGVSHLEGISCSSETFFQALRDGAEVSTSQPSPGVILRLWEALLREHESVLHFPMSSGLSGSCQTARALAQEYPGRVFVVDNRRISLTLEQSIRDARMLLAAGRSAAQVREILEREALSSSIYLSVNTLEYLKRSGRVTPAAAAMAAVLNLKPVLQIQGGKLDSFRKARGMVQARKLMLEALRRDLKDRFGGKDMAVFAAYSGSQSQGLDWLEEVRAAFPNREIRLAALPISICCHVGDGTLAVACARQLNVSGAGEE